MIEIIPKPKLNIVLDASKIDSFETCPAKYNFRHNLNKIVAPRQLQTKRNALDLGSLAHHGLEVYLKELAIGTHYDHRIQKSLMKIRELASDPDISNSSEDEVNEILKAIEESCDFWRSEDENCLEILAVEEVFAYELFSDNDVRIIISGKIDLIVNYNSIGRGASYKSLPFDHKTFTRESALLRKSNQFINYCNAVKSNYLIVNRIGLQKTKTAEERFKRLPLSYDPDYIKSWRDNLTRMILNEYLTCVAQNEWVEKPTSCNKFNRLCEYYPICDSSGEDSKIIKLETEYIDAPIWDVTEGLNNKD